MRQPIRRRALIPALLLILGSARLHAQLDRLEIEGYAILTYSKYWWQIDPDRRAAIDIERVAIEPTYRLTDNIRLEGEIEFEHGGTGTTMEFDKFEEFGEFEQEIEKGGEVVIEKLAAVIEIDSMFNIRVGHFYVPIGLVNVHYEPNDYFTVSRSSAEFNLIPATWHETGIEIFGALGSLRYRTQVVNGLDATGFSSATWVRYGHQGRFETINAENMAVAGRLEYDPIPQTTLGASGYYGNSADNRPKPDLDVPANVGIIEFDGSIESGPLTARGLLLYGTLRNAAAVSKANRNLSNNLNVKRTPVGSAALGWFVEAGYDLLTLFSSASASSSPTFNIFARYEFYDSMHNVDEGVFDNPRWERSAWTVGANYHLNSHLVLKGEFSERTLGTAVDNLERTAALGMGVEF